MELDGALAERVQKSSGHEFVERHWGSYVAVFGGNGADEVHILRDPLETAPCYYFRCDELWLVASDIATARQFTEPPASIDWSAITQQLLRPDLRTATTCISGVTELPGGHRLTLRQDGSKLEELWSPAKFARPRDNVIGKQEAIERVRRVTLNSVHAWASCYRNILIQISGGLDSSILAAALRGNRAQLSALTIATTQPEGDERDHASLVADHLGFPLQDAFFDPRRVDITVCDGAHLPRPCARSHVQETDRLTLLAAKAVGAEVVFNGNAGDAVFCFLQSASPVADRLLADGIGGALQTSVDVSHITGVGIWSVLHRGISRAASWRRPYRWRMDTRYLHADVIAAGPDASAHPWLDSDATLLPGKLGQLAGLAQSHYHREGFASGGPIFMVSPLLSQPLVELCLAVPSWMWCAGGVNRALARAAFERDLPRQIIQRRSKGSPDSLLLAILELNRPALIKWLCDGLLASRNIIDVDSVRAQLARSGPTTGTDYIRLLDLADVEAWARSQPA
ncbi:MULTISPECIES: asparagine synthetase B family protein [Sphingobium]|uniref:asparagine synthase-related protein n=1 Tax=Sphingobium sp. TA15 TaxID=2905832 RepID=UPI001375A8C5|nr:asparagine synthetase B family protein [Sphingobium indicum]